MARKKTTIYIDENLLRSVKVLAARTGKRDYEIFEDALKERLGLSLIERIRQRADLSEEEALQLAYEELHAMRRERDEAAQEREARA